MAEDATLERAGLYRLLAELLVDAPDDALLDLAATVPGLAGRAPGNAAERFTRVFVLNAYPFGSVYLSPDASIGGERTGFTRGVLEALGLTVEDGLAADHAAVLLGSLSALLEREAAADDGLRAERARHGQRILLAEHLLPWAPHFLDAVERLDDGLYGAAAGLARRLLTEDARELFEGRTGDAPSAAIAAHADGPHAGAASGRPPSDPDEAATGEDASPLVALTRPARCGFFLAREDIATIAAQLALPVRFGGRSFMLESMVEAAAQAGAGDALSGALTRFALERRAVLDAWSSAIPGLAPMWRPALARLDAAVADLRDDAGGRPVAASEPLGAPA